MTNNYQQILISALALEHKVDLISFFCATEGQAALNPVIGLVNDGLHPECPAASMDDIAPGEMHDVYCDQWPELIVMLPTTDAIPDGAACSPVAYWGCGMDRSPMIEDIDKN